MKITFLVLLFSVYVSAYPYSSSLSVAQEGFLKWKKTFNKVYETLEHEEARFMTWVKNMDTIISHNLAFDLNQKSYRLEMNHFGDMNSSEFRKTMNGYKMSMKKLKFRPKGASFLLSLVNTTLPHHVDWRDHGYVTPVKDQKQCGSCWSFSATGSLEGQMKRKTGKLVSLSEQNLVDCSGPEGNDGCNGGLMDQAFDYIKINGGIDTEESYPYEAIDDTCKYSKSNIGGEDVGYVDITQGDEHALKHAVANQGPISVAIDASQPSFQFYSSGVYDEPNCSSDQLDHGVLVAGYGESNGSKYWLVKNSWSSNWGDEGYIKMSRGKSNQCGIASSASYPLV